MLASQVASLRREVTGLTKNFEDETSYRRFLYWDLKPVCPQPVLFYPLLIIQTLISVGARVLPNNRNLLRIPWNRLARKPSFVVFWENRSSYAHPPPTYIHGVSVGWATSLGFRVRDDSPYGLCHWIKIFGWPSSISFRRCCSIVCWLEILLSNPSASKRNALSLQYLRSTVLCGTSLLLLRHFSKYNWCSLQLACLFLVGTSMSHAAFNMLAIGLRYACEMGVHRRQGPHQKPSVESEMQKRAFWLVLAFFLSVESYLWKHLGLCFVWIA